MLVTHSVDEAVYLADRIAIVSPRPGRIESTITVSIPRPRDRANPRFAKLSKEILDHIVGQGDANGSGSVPPPRFS